MATSYAGNLVACEHQHLCLFSNLYFTLSLRDLPGSRRVCTPCSLAVGVMSTDQVPDAARAIWKGTRRMQGSCTHSRTFIAACPSSAQKTMQTDCKGLVGTWSSGHSDAAGASKYPAAAQTSTQSCHSRLRCPGLSSIIALVGHAKKTGSDQCTSMVHWLHLFYTGVHKHWHSCTCTHECMPLHSCIVTHATQPP